MLREFGKAIDERLLAGGSSKIANQPFAVATHKSREGEAALPNCLYTRQVRGRERWLRCQEASQILDCRLPTEQERRKRFAAGPPLAARRMTALF